MVRRAASLVLCFAIVALFAPAARVVASGAALGGQFIENRGQWPGPARYSVDLGTAVVRADDDGLTIDLVPWMTAVRVDLPPASARRVTAQGEQATRWHFFVGDPSRWRSDLPGFATLAWHDAETGTELRLRPQPNGLLFEEEGTDVGRPRRTRPHYRGVDRIESTADGRRLLRAGGAELVELPSDSGDHRWILRWGPGATERESDPGRSNPDALLWSTYLGEAHNEYGQGVVLDGSGRPVLTGYTNSGAFPTTPGAYDRTLAGSYDVFVAKMSADGSALLWGTYLGGAAEDRAFDLELDEDDQVVVVGHTFSADFPTTPGALDRSLSGFKDAFVSKLSASGSALLWSTYLGGVSGERAFMVRVDAAGNVVTSGETASSDFPLTPDAFDASLGGAQDGFVVRLHAAGGSLLYGTLLGGADAEFLLALALDAQDRALVSGSTRSTDFPVSAGAYDVTPGGGADAFVARVDLGAAGLIASTRLGGLGDDFGYGVCEDANGGIHVAGSTLSPDFPTTPFAEDRTWNGADDVFYARLDGPLTNLLGGTFLGGTGAEVAFALVLDPWGYPILTGETYSSGFPTTPDGYSQNGHTWERDAFVSRLDPDGPSLVWSTFLGGNDYDAGWDLEPSGLGRVIVTGPTRSVDFPTTAGAFDRTYNGDQQDVFLAELEYAEGSGLEPPLVLRPVFTAAPNPFREEVTLRFRLERSQDVSLAAFDARGRVAAMLLRGRLPAGEVALRWDGTTENGRTLPAGIYWLECRTGSGTWLRRVVRVR